MDYDVCCLLAVGEYEGVNKVEKRLFCAPSENSEVSIPKFSIVPFKFTATDYIYL